MSQPATEAGWTVIAHPLFVDQLEELVNDAPHSRPTRTRISRRSPALGGHPETRVRRIPDPTLDVYRQGDTLGDEYKHWFRAKFFQQYRLFFRYHQSAKLIVIAWVNDEDTKRAYGSKKDAYRVFRKMLNDGHPPDSWGELVAQATTDPKRVVAVVKGMEKALGTTTRRGARGK